MDDKNVIRFGEVKFRKKRENSCRHQGGMEYDPTTEQIECTECGLILNNFKAFMIIVESFGGYQEKREKDIDNLNKLKEETLVLKAAKKAESAWRSRNMVPTCPHCHEAVFPEDGFGGSLINREMEIKRREKYGKPDPKGIRKLLAENQEESKGSRGDFK